MRPFLSRGLVLLAAAASLACDNQNLDFVVGPGTSQTIQASAISLSTSAPTLTVGQSVQLTAVVQDASGNPIQNPTVKWSSSNTSIATVSATGLVAAVALGTANITAASGNVSKSATVSVADAQTPPPPVQPGTPAPSSFTLPKLLDTSMPTAPAAGGKVITVAANGDFQAAINAAQPGDVIELARGATYTGHFTLPDKGASTSWIVIRPASGAALPVEGQRMTPALAASLSLPKIVTPDYQAAIATKLGAHHYRIIGMEVTVAPAQTLNYGIVLMGSGDVDQTTVSSIAHDLVLDRVYIHGTDVASVKRCVGLNSASTAIIDSYLSECHAEGQDAQAIGGWNGSGPFKIVNNYLEGSAENVMFGGAEPAVPGLVPSDIELRKNHITKPVSWRGSRWLIKNLLELKSAQRVLVEGNVFENNWQDGQEGSAIVMWDANRAATSQLQDVTFRLNVVRNVGAGFQLAANAVATAPGAQRIAISDNLIYGINIPGFSGVGRGFQIGGGTVSIVDLSISHNTIIGSTSTAITFTGHPTTRLSVVDNVLSGGAYGVIGDGTGVGTASLTSWAPGAVFAGNVLVVAPDAVSQFPSANFYPASEAAIGFVNMGAGDYHLSPASPYKATGSSADPGANIDAVAVAVSGVTAS